jgi:hypothetical protein
MLGGNAPAVALLFAALATIFLAVTLRDYLRSEGKLTAGRQTWLRMTFIFAGLVVGLFAWYTFFA